MCGQNPLLMDYSDEQLRQRYRFGRDSIMYLSDLLRDKLERLTRRKTSLTVEEKVMIALRFFASGSHLQVIGDTMGHDKSTISRVIRQVADALVEMKDTFIKWPQTPEKLNSIKSHEFPIGTRLVIINIQSVPKFKNKVPTFSPLFYFKKNDVPDV
jgi:hypothetical protein